MNLDQKTIANEISKAIKKIAKDRPEKMFPIFVDGQAKDFYITDENRHKYDVKQVGKNWYRVDLRNVL